MKLKLLIVLTALALAACGGGEPSTSRTATAETQAAAPSRAETSATGRSGAADASAARAAAEDAGQSQASQPARLAQSDDSAGASISPRFEAGKSYEVISPVQPTSTGPEQVEVAEFFMYSCIHCYNFDPYVEEWKQTIPEYVNFIRVPVVWNSLARIHGQAFYTAEALGKRDEMHKDFFREIHVNGNLLQTEDALAEFFGRYGVSREEFEKTFNSFSVNAKVQRADELMRRYDVSATPTMIVNGKYRSEGSMTGGYDTLLELVDELAAAEHDSD